MRFKDIVPGMTIHCQSVAERLFLLEQLEEMGYVWEHNGEKPTESLPTNPSALYISTKQDKKLTYSCFGETALDYSCLCIGIDTDIAYYRGLDVAWNLMKKLCLSEKDGGLDRNTYIDCFGTGASVSYILTKYECREVLNILDEYNNGLKAEDIVEINGEKAVVVAKSDGKIYVIYADGTCRNYQEDNQDIKKTGEVLRISKLLSTYLEMEK